VLPIVEIRKATRKDIPILIKFCKDLQDHHEEFNRGPVEGIFELKKNWRPIFRKFLEKRIRARNSRAYVAEADGKVIGHMLVTINKIFSILLHNREVYVEGIYVENAWRGKGIGKMFLKEAERWARERRIYTVGLTVHVNNKDAFSAYRKSGFWEHNFKMNKIVRNRK
jgi:ribosomal protein S18 acetylase RimI-like enzyme